MHKLQLLQVFEHTVRQQSFAAAARELGLTPSTVSKAVARLEASVDMRLFHRTTRSLTLTSDGERLFARCQRVIDEMRALEDDLAGARNQTSGVLRIDLPVVYGRRVVLPLLSRLAAEHPGLRFDIRMSDAYADLVREGLDLAVRIGTLPDSGLIARRFSQQQWILCASPVYLQQQGTPAGLGDLAHHHAIAFKVPTTGRDLAWRFKGLPRDNNAMPRPHSRFTDGESMVRAAELGMGLAQVPDYMAQDAIAQGRLVELLKPLRPPAAPIHAVMPANRMVPGRVKAVLAALNTL